MPDRVLNTLLEDRPQYDKYAMTVTKGLEPVLAPNDPRRKKKKKRLSAPRKKPRGKAFAKVDLGSIVLTHSPGG